MNSHIASLAGNLARLEVSIADETARELVAAFAPIIQARIARVLRRSAQGRGRDAAQEVDDLTQEVLIALFDDDAKILRSWNPERGLSLENFVGLVSERRVRSILRTKIKSPWTEQPAESSDLEAACGVVDPEGESRLLSREKLERTVARLREELSPRAFEIFHRLLVEEESVVSLSSSTGMSPAAIYAWRSRLSRELHALAVELARASVQRIPAARQNG